MIEYISQEGYDKMVAELHELMSVERPRISEAISEARDKGDVRTLNTMLPSVNRAN